MAVSAGITQASAALLKVWLKLACAGATSYFNCSVSELEFKKIFVCVCDKSDTYQQL